MIDAARRVTLVRHAHAEWPGFQGGDFDRPLTTRGQAQAQAAARAIAGGADRPTRLLASPARRTRQTAEAIAAALELGSHEVRFVESLYNASEDVLEAELQRQRDAPHVVLVAHNPGISQLARRLSGDGRRAAFEPGEWLVLPLRGDPAD